MKDPMFSIRRSFNLSVKQAQIFNLLLNHQYVTADMIEHQFKIYSDAKVAMHKLRRCLIPANINIEAMRGTGYYLDDAVKKEIWAVLAPSLAA